MLHKILVGGVLGSICAVSGYLIGSQIPPLNGQWWAGWTGGLVGLVVALLTMQLEQAIKRVPLKTIIGGTLGLVTGLGIAKLASYPFNQFLELPKSPDPFIYFLFSNFRLYRLDVGRQKNGGD